MEQARKELLFFNFNQDSSCIIVGTEDGFIIYNINPLKEIGGRFLEAGIGIAEMFFRSNMIALTGGGKNPVFPLNNIILWDDANEEEDRVKGEISLPRDVLRIYLRLNNIAAITIDKAYIYVTESLQFSKDITTAENLKGLSCVNHSDTMIAIGVPCKKQGAAEIHFFNENQKSPVIIQAHHRKLGAIEMNNDGTLIATASEKGTVIRVFNTKSGEKLRDLKRGSYDAQIHSIAFDPESNWIACTSSSPTVHIYSMKENQHQNPKSKLAFMPLTIFQTERSFAKFEIKNLGESKVTFLEKNKIGIISKSNQFYKLIFDPQAGGDCMMEMQKNLSEVVNYQEVILQQYNCN